MTRGYGLFDVRRNGKRVVHRAHRLAFILRKGDVPADQPLIRHTCDNPPCCNPAHLIAGTAADNMADLVSRGRHWTAVRPECIPRGDEHWSRRKAGTFPRGEDHHAVRLTRAEVTEIRRRYEGGGVSQRSLAAEYNVSQGLIWKIVTWQLWRHEIVPGKR